MGRLLTRYVDIKVPIDWLRTDGRTREHAAHCISEGHSKIEVFRLLKLYIAHEAYEFIVKRLKRDQ